ncbi:hypothetical protein MUP65_01390, partial [Patescibacteria group bacterium]|nr:hypothetical protein [Patescibacteria group bacterium]
VTKTESETLLAEYQRVLGVAWQEEKQVLLTEVFDLKSISAQAEGEGLVFVNNQLYLADQSGSFWYRVEPEFGRGEPIAVGEKIGRFDSFGLENRRLYALNQEGVWEVAGDASVMVIDQELKGNELLAGFNSNLYLLDREDWEVYRFMATEEGFGSELRWLQEAVKEAVWPVRMVIDGQIWVLDEEGQLFVLSQGVGRLVDLDSPRLPLEKVVDFTLSGDQKRLFVLDGPTQRLLVYTQSGEYQAQYAWAESIEASQITVNGEGRLIWLLGGSKIYQLEI